MKKKENRRVQLKPHLPKITEYQKGLVKTTFTQNDWKTEGFSQKHM